MAKGNNSHKKEIKKPKKEKPKTQPTPGSFLGTADRSANPSGGGKKKGR